MNFDQDQYYEHYTDADTDVDEEDEGDEEFNGSVHEDYEANSVCSVFKYSLNLFGTRVNIWVLLLVILLIVGALFYQQNKRLPTFKDISDKFSSTSSMNTINKQMGGFDSSHSLSATPNFIRNLKY